MARRQKGSEPAEETMPIRLSQSVGIWLKEEATRQWAITGHYVTPDLVIRQLIKEHEKNGANKTVG